jgi:hypothetical protein
MAAGAFASEAENIGLTAMRRERAAITGAGIPVAHPEGQADTNAWEVNPIINPLISFTWISSSGTATNFPNAVGFESWHANGVADSFYGIVIGVAPGVPTVDSYDADYFVTNLVTRGVGIRGRVVNQSFVFRDELSVPIDLIYDGYASTFNVLFVSGMDNVPGTPPAPGTCYNGIGVGFLCPNSQSSIGPTIDGRAKPDLVVQDICASSFTTPLVAGAAALLLQAGTSNDGGPGTAPLATNSTVIKALLLNGAVKTTNWTNGVTRPLDARYGAGVLNIYNSDLQLRGARHVAIATNSVSAGAPHPPTGDTGNVARLRGWDFSSIRNTGQNDRVAHYYFDLPPPSGAYSGTATLVWKKGTGLLPNLDLFLYHVGSNTLVRSSTSAIDNVEHIFIPRLPAGRYDLQVLKHAGAGSEDYALAFDFSPAQLTIGRTGDDVVISWPASPAGFILQMAPSLSSPIPWETVATESTLNQAMNTVTRPASSAQQFFRLFRP